MFLNCCPYDDDNFGKAIIKLTYSKTYQVETHFFAIGSLPSHMQICALMLQTAEDNAYEFCESRLEFMVIIGNYYNDLLIQTIIVNCIIENQGNKKQSFYLTSSNYCLDRPFLNERIWL